MQFSSLLPASVIIRNASTPEDWGRPGEAQKEAERLFPEIVEKSGLKLWRPGDPIPERGTRLLIGVATYSLIELYILDALNERLTYSSELDVRVDVFALSACKTLEEIRSYIPNILPMATPVMGIWSEGKLIKSLGGGAANQYLREYFQLNGILDRLMKKEERVAAEVKRLQRERRTGFVQR